MSKLVFYGASFSYFLCLITRWEYFKGILKGSTWHLFNKGESCEFRVVGLSMVMPFRCFRSQYKFIFIEEEYGFPWNNDAPAILDLGANFGMSCAYFLTKFPKCKLVSLEADPEIFGFLSENVKSLGAADRVEVVNCAAWIFDGVLKFNPDGLDGGAVSNSGGSIDIPCLDVKRLMREKSFDVIKIDIEGAERVVIPHIMEELEGVKLIIFEYHSEYGKPQNLAEIIAGLSTHGFRFHFRSEDYRVSPFDVEDAHGFENRVVIYCYRPEWFSV